MFQNRNWLCWQCKQLRIRIWIFALKISHFMHSTAVYKFKIRSLPQAFALRRLFHFWGGIEILNKRNSIRWQYWRQHVKCYIVNDWLGSSDKNRLFVEMCTAFELTMNHPPCSILSQIKLFWKNLKNVHIKGKKQ